MRTRQHEKARGTPVLPIKTTYFGNIFDIYSYPGYIYTGSGSVLYRRGMSAVEEAFDFLGPIRYILAAEGLVGQGVWPGPLCTSSEKGTPSHGNDPPS